jgi:hypothetical protein
VTRSDVALADLEQLDWSPDKREASLTRVFEHATGLCRDAEGWYGKRRGYKRHWGRALRMGAILLAAAAAVLPVVIEITKKSSGATSISPAWSSIGLALSALLVALDRLLGFSSAWMRFMTTQLRLGRLRHDFEYAWQQGRLAADLDSEADVKGLIALACQFVLAVDDALADETTGWIGEFRTSLAQTERGLQSTQAQ